jgi:hypothetical protein
MARTRHGSKAPADIPEERSDTEQNEQGKEVGADTGSNRGSDASGEENNPSGEHDDRPDQDEIDVMIAKSREAAETANRRAKELEEQAVQQKKKAVDKRIIELAALEKSRAEAEARIDSLMVELEGSGEIRGRTGQASGSGDINRAVLHHRRRSTSPRVSRPKMRELPEYYGNNITEAMMFKARVERQFRQDKGHYFPSDQDKIDYCVGSFRGNAEKKWTRFEAEKEDKSITWTDFTEWLFDSIQDKTNRLLEACIKYARAMQRNAQSTDDFADYLDIREQQLGIKDDHTRMCLLFGKLRPEIQERVSNYNDVPSTRAELISLASRLEQSLKLGIKRHLESDHYAGDNRSSSPNKGRNFNDKGRGSRPPGKLPYRSNDNPATGVNTMPQGVSPSESDACFRCHKTGHQGWQCPDVECFKCHKKGHFASRCPDLLSGNGQARR